MNEDQLENTSNMNYPASYFISFIIYCLIGCTTNTSKNWQKTGNENSLIKSDQEIETVLINYDSAFCIKKVKTCWTSKPKQLYLSRYYDSNERLIFFEKELPDSSIQFIHFDSEMDSTGKMIAGEILFNEYFFSYFFQKRQIGLKEIKNINDRDKSKEFIYEIAVKQFGENVLNSEQLELIVFFAYNK